jgi:hypothetical protein
MGSCQSDEVIEIDSGMKNKANNQDDLNPNGFGKTLNKDPDFPDMEEWPGERYKGIGIKRMKGYKCTLKIDELIKKREEFWKCKDEISEIWNVINQACVYDVYRANMLLEKYNLKCVDGCINHIVDEQGNDYYIPNYCINDPYFEKLGIAIEILKVHKIKDAENNKGYIYYYSAKIFSRLLAN